jgi:hypothetical protein
MIAHYEIEQGSEEWHKIRYGKVGGTLSKGLFIKSDTLLEDVLSELVEDFDLQESYQSFDMVRGNELEPEARKSLNAYLGIELLECGWLQSEENEYIGISPDGITEDETISAEIKCPASKKHLKTVRSGEIPADNIHQCLHYFTVNPKLQKHYFCSYRPENIYKPIFVKELTLDSVIDLGVKKKVEIKQYGVGGKEIKPKTETVTDFRTIREWVELAKFNADLLKNEIEIELNKLKF